VLPVKIIYRQGKKGEHNCGEIFVLNKTAKGVLTEAELLDVDTVTVRDDGAVEDLLAVLADEALPLVRPGDNVFLVAAMARVAGGGTFCVV
jgi:hypothetical protein